MTMLGPKALERLEERDKTVPKITAINDFRAKKKLEKWLIAASDMLLILQKLPLEKLEKDLSDADVYRLLNIVKYIMTSKNFMAIAGELEKPEKWRAVGYGIDRSADITDIARASILAENLEGLETFVGVQGPINAARHIFYGLNDPDNKFRDRFPPGVIVAANKVNKSVKTYIKQFKKIDVGERAESERGEEP